MLRAALVVLALSTTPLPSAVSFRSESDVRPMRNASIAADAPRSFDQPSQPQDRQVDSGPRWDGSRPRFVPPVGAPVADPFRAPEGPYGPGNRGIEYATAPGTAVRAIGSGVVAFAGSVAGRGVVSIDHPSGLRSTYTGLAQITVVVGAPVAQRDMVGRTATHLHLGLRDGRRYLDPAAFFGGARAVLVE